MTLVVLDLETNQRQLVTPLATAFRYCRSWSHFCICDGCHFLRGARTKPPSKPERDSE
jgi:hypothetical protein